METPTKKQKIDDVDSDIPSLSCIVCMGKVSNGGSQWELEHPNHEWCKCDHLQAPPTP